MNKKHWYDYLWLWSLIYFVLGFFNILFAWLGMIDFLLPIGIAVFAKNKAFCNNFCGRGQLFTVLGINLKLSTKKSTPKWMNSKLFRYGFLTFFMIMFLQMIFTTYLVFSETKELQEVIKLFWSIKFPWDWAYTVKTVPAWITQFAFGFYSMMLTSTIIGLITMLMFKPRTWCSFCPMGTMTQAICKIQNHAEDKENYKKTDTEI